MKTAQIERRCSRCPQMISQADLASGATACRSCRQKKKSRQPKGSARKQFADALLEGRRRRRQRNKKD